MFYKLEGSKPVPVDDVLEMARQMEGTGHVVASTERVRILAALPLMPLMWARQLVSWRWLVSMCAWLSRRASIRVSTVFLCIDHSFGGGRPILWETMIFGGRHNGNQWRYSSLEEAQQGHIEAVAKAFPFIRPKTEWGPASNVT